jgi:hypothetical protein
LRSISSIRRSSSAFLRRHRSSNRRSKERKRGRIRFQAKDH